MTDDNERDRPTRQEILERFGWQPGEKEQLEREVAERQRLNDETHAAEASRQRETGQQPAPVDTETIRQRRDKAAADAKWWKTYIRAHLDQRTKDMFKAIAPVIVKEQKARALDIDEVRSQYRDICARFDDHPRHDVVKSLRKRIDELQERIDSLEKAAAQPAARTLKSVG
jgi:hypothetical protein